MPIQRRWTDDQLREAVAASTSYKMVCRLLGLSNNGGNVYHVRARARELSIDEKHLRGARGFGRCTDEEVCAAVASSTSFVMVFDKLGVRPGGTANVKLRARIRELGLDTRHFVHAGQRRQHTWTDDQLRAAVASSESYSKVIRKLGLVPAGGNYVQVRGRIDELALETSHFTGKGWSLGLKIGPRSPLPLEKILVAGRLMTGHHLKQRLFRAGLKQPACELCGWATRSPDGRIPIEIDHINGDHNDNRLQNLRILCPNCHSLQPTHRGRNRRRRRK